ncbi:MAG: WD40/YVTN/BNR-like repeat-containing protein [Gemmataceae bacterium]
MKVLPRLIGLAILLVLSSHVYAVDEPKGGPPEFKHLKFRSIGPATGGRVSRSVGVPGDPLTYYAATASGGVWKSVDGGLNWKPVFDDQPLTSVGSIAVSPSDPNVLYVGSGEGNPRGNVAPGNGIYKSTDAGKTWQHVWKQEGQIGTMAVHPANPDIAFAAVLGHAFGPNPERGVYRTTDGGKTWMKVLFKDAETGASDVCLDPNNPRIVFAGLWQMRRRPWEMTSGGPGSGLYVSRDGGETWKQLGPANAATAAGSASGSNAASKSDEKPNGLPEGVWGKIGVAVAPSDSRRVYALIEAEKGGLFRSDDGGGKWERVNGGHYLSQRAWYYTTLAIDPSNRDVVYFPQVHLLRTIDGGKTIKQVKGPHHGDHHDVWIDPKNAKRVIDSNDGGVDISTNAGETWYAPPLPISQFYHIACDNSVPYRVSGCMQDLGSACGPSNSLSAAGIGLGDWFEIGGGEAGFTAPDPADPEIMYAGEYGGIITRYNHRLRQARNISVYPTNPSGHGGEDLKYRFQWTAPILVSPHDPKTIYHAANVVFKSTDAGQTWQAISGDLTRDDKSKEKWSGGPITGDNTGVEIYCTIFALAESPKQKDLLWAGSDDGLVHFSPDGGKSWTKVTIPGLPEWATVACIEPSPFDAAAAYVVVDAHRNDDTRPYLFKTEDGGKTWKALASKLAQDTYLHAVREDPKRKGLLYAGTERGVVFSPDDGVSWKELKLNLPAVPVHDLQVKGNDLVVGTHGRSVWIFDDLTPIREFDPKIATADLHLFAVQPATRFRLHGSYAGKGSGENPPQGALIEYYLKNKPKGEVTIEILDDNNGLVTRLTSKEDKEKPVEEDPDYREPEFKKEPLTKEIGVNRAVWGLRYDGARKIKNAKIDTGDIDAGPLVIGGKFTVKLTVDGKSQTTKATVGLDRRVLIVFKAEAAVPGTTAAASGDSPGLKIKVEESPATLRPPDLEKQLALTLKIRDDLSQFSDTVNGLRSLGKQIKDRNELLKDEPKAEPLIKASKEFLEKVEALEARMHNPKAEVVYDILAQKGGAQLYSKLAFLFEIAKEADGPPTQGLKDEYADQGKQLQKYLGEWKSLKDNDLARINEQAKKLDLPIVLLPSSPKAEEK